MSDDIKKRFDFPNSLIQSQVIFIYFSFMVTKAHF
ncbi:mCG6580, isoform CRA_b [Mus musculus]|nr:mCG6580, isoform CRA_b [Mus musculus]